MKKVLVVFGTRPEAIKLAPVIYEMSRRSDHIAPVVAVTGQHRELLSQVLEAFSIIPRHDLDVMSPNQSLHEAGSRILIGLERVLRIEKPEFVLVQGDTTTTLFGALAAFYQKIPVGHVEAGLRSGDKFQPYPEEINRVLTSRVADLHFCPTQRARLNLLNEHIAPERVFVTGNTVVDAFLHIVGEERIFADELAAIDFAHRKVVVVTLHRRENVGEPLENVCRALKRIASSHPEAEIVFPVHPNPNVRSVIGRELRGLERIHLVEPLSYPVMAHLLRRCHLILTDSGGLQEEGLIAGKPVLVLREVTERPEGVEAGGAKVVGTDAHKIYEQVALLLEDERAYDAMSKIANPYGDGHAAERIVDVLVTGRCEEFLQPAPLSSALWTQALFPKG